MRTYIALALLLTGVGLLGTARGQPSEGQRLLEWCSAADALPARSEIEAINRVACLQTIRATVSLQRAQNLAAAKWNSEAKPDTTGRIATRSLPGPFCLVFREDQVYSVVDAMYDARGLVRYLRRQPKAALESQGRGDDVTTRLVLEYLTEAYPCTAPGLVVFDPEVRRSWR